MAPGRPGRAIALAGSDAPAAIDALVRAAARRSGAVELQAAMNLAGKSDLALSAAIDSLRREVEARASGEVDPVRAGELASAALELSRLGQEAQALNQDRGQTAAAAVALVQACRAL